MTRRESIEATIFALLFMMDKAKEDAKGDIEAYKARRDNDELKR